MSRAADVHDFYREVRQVRNLGRRARSRFRGGDYRDGDDDDLTPVEFVVGPRSSDVGEEVRLYARVTVHSHTLTHAEMVAEVERRWWNQVAEERACVTVAPRTEVSRDADGPFVTAVTEGWGRRMR